MKNIVIFASGSGTNALNLIQYFKKGNLARVVAVFCNNPDAGVIQKAHSEQVPVHIFNKAQLKEAGDLDTHLSDYNPDCIALAGFLLLFPQRWVEKYEDKIVNIHPALLPKYGGKGMYGDNVHKAVLEAKEKTHGVTVHLVNEQYDKGKILLQESFEVENNDDLNSIAKKIHQIEFKIFPKAIENLLLE